MNQKSIVSITTTLFAAAAVWVLTDESHVAQAKPRPEERVDTAQAEGRAAVAKIARGSYLVTIMGCNDCHTPWAMGPKGPAPDMKRMLSGHPQDVVVTAPPALGGPWVWGATGTNTAFAGPWGISFTANLTPDRETGLGAWTEETFIRALRTGRHEGQGRPILPPMPYPMYSKASDADLSAIFTFLRSIPAIQNRVPQPIDPPGNL